jgi:hypothetical protein
LKVIPDQDSKDSKLPSVDVFFDDIYFDMSGQEVVMQKVSN